MSGAASLTKKQKKALAFREKKGGRGGKPAAAEPDALPEMDAEESDDEEEETIAPSKAKAQDGKSKKELEKLALAEKKKAAEKEKEKSVKAKGKEKAIDGDVEIRIAPKEGEEGVEVKKVEKKNKKEIKQRFIVFVGRIDYKTTKSAISEHFRIDPQTLPSVRLLTTPAIPPTPSAPRGVPSKSRGIAFLEFPSSTALQAALKLHHSELDGKVINVELTAGGGGGGEERKRKIGERNERVGVQRVKREEKQREEGGEAAAAEGGEVDGEEPKKKKARGGRRGKEEPESNDPNPGWTARAAGKSATVFPAPAASRGGRGGFGARGGGGGRGGRGGGRGGRGGFELTGANAMIVG